MDLTIIAVALALAVLVGLSLGLLGGGGSILAVPIMSYVIGMEPQEAISSSLFVVGVASAVGVLSHARNHRVSWKIGAIFGAAGMAGAFLGGYLGGFVPGPVLMVLFALVMVATAGAMIRGRKSPGANREPGVLGVEMPVLRVIIYGLLVGLVTGLVGAGGGFLIVPTLTLLVGLPMTIAAATSLLVITINSLAGLSGHLLNTSVDWPIVLFFTAGTVAGSLVGVRLADRIPERALRRGFGVFVLAIGALVLTQEIPGLL